MIAEDTKADVALVHFKATEQIPVLPLGKAWPVNEPVASVGFPMNDKWSIFNFATRRRDEITHQPEHGESGSPVLRKGYVIGMISARITQPLGDVKGYAVPIEKIRDFLSECSDQLGREHPALKQFGAKP